MSVAATAGQEPAAPSSRIGTALGDLASILRLHITLIAVLATVVFGWLLTGRYAGLAALVVGVDWLLINLVNRVTDLVEDIHNGIRGTDRIAARPRLYQGLAFALLAGSFALTHALLPALTPFRVAVQAIGLAYSYRLVPTPRGLRRFKDLYAWKNGMSAVLFLLTVLAYPLALAGGPVAAYAGWASVVALGGFFFLFELSYEVIYDLRDLDGDRLAGVPTFPVVHGPAAGRRIVEGLCLASALPLAAGLLFGGLGVREGLLLAAPLIQVLVFRPWARRGLVPRDCIRITNLGSLLLVVYLVGTRVWLAAGLPANFGIRG